ncbi:head decoration protein [Microbacterium thalli]|uniref:head decoration protein n=1 Tax=Microbacterium thalli TaxID=3027921 RepID=UPI002366643D|nr:head decoration protein [Microbacterium thalli]MDD7930076.1 head decoration protein [Microbacterium thalli]
MPKLRTENFGSGDQTWLGSTHGIRNARTEILDVSTFTAADHYPDGYIPSGTPVAKVGGKLVPYDPTAGTTTGAGVLAGHILTDQKVVGSADFGVPLFDHGRVIASKVAGILSAWSSFVAPAGAKNGSNILYV